MPTRKRNAIRGNTAAANLETCIVYCYRDSRPTSQNVGIGANLDRAIAQQTARQDGNAIRPPVRYREPDGDAPRKSLGASDNCGATGYAPGLNHLCSTAYGGADSQTARADRIKTAKEDVHPAGNVAAAQSNRPCVLHGSAARGIKTAHGAT